MIKLGYPKENINVNKLHEQLALTETFYLTHDDESFYLTFPDIKELISEENVVSYQKRITQFNEENQVEIESWVGVDFQLVIDEIEIIITNHDPTPKPIPLTETEKLWDTINYLINSSYEV